MKPQQTIEPVRVRPDHPPIPGTSKPSEPTAPAPAPIQPGKPEQALLPVAQKPQPKVKEPSKKSGSGVTAAIVATVVIVLGLAALAVVAYIKTKNS